MINQDLSDALKNLPRNEENEDKVYMVLYAWFRNTYRFEADTVDEWGKCITTAYSIVMDLDELWRMRAQIPSRLLHVQWCAMQNGKWWQQTNQNRVKKMKYTTSGMDLLGKANIMWLLPKTHRYVEWEFLFFADEWLTLCMYHRSQNEEDRRYVLRKHDDKKRKHELTHC